MNAPHRLSACSVRTAAAADLDRLDAFVHAHPDATPFHRPVWSLAVERGTGQRAHLLVAEAKGQIAGFLPLTELRSRLFGTALVSAGFAVEGGILANDPAAADALADAAVALADRVGCASAELRGGPVPSGWRRSEGVYFGFARDLPADDEAILKSIPRKQRAEVRKGLAARLDAAFDADPADHLRVYSESVRNLGTPVFPRRLFAAMLDAFGPDADILTVRRDGRPLASVLTLYFRGTVYPFWGGGTFEARGARANEILYYELMRRAAARGCTRFDFGRSKVGTGAFAYKKNWGFEPSPLVYARWGEGRDVNPASPRYRLKVAAWKKLPLGLANLLGPPIARGLG